MQQFHAVIQKLKLWRVSFWKPGLINYLSSNGDFCMGFVVIYNASVLFLNCGDLIYSGSWTLYIDLDLKKDTTLKMRTGSAILKVMWAKQIRRMLFVF